MGCPCESSSIARLIRLGFAVWPTVIAEAKDTRTTTTMIRARSFLIVSSAFSMKNCEQYTYNPADHPNKRRTDETRFNSVIRLVDSCRTAQRASRQRCNLRHEEEDHLEG